MCSAIRDSLGTYAKTASIKVNMQHDDTVSRLHKSVDYTFNYFSFVDFNAPGWYQPYHDHSLRWWRADCRSCEKMGRAEYPPQHIGEVLVIRLYVLTQFLLIFFHFIIKCFKWYKVLTVCFLYAVRNTVCCWKLEFIPRLRNRWFLLK